MRCDRLFGFISVIDGQLSASDLGKFFNLSMASMAALSTVALYLASGQAIKVNQIVKPAVLQFTGPTVKAGDQVGRYAVSSGWGKRSRPCVGCSAYHRGVDLAAPFGSPVFAIGKASQTIAVTCKDDMIRQTIAGYSIEILHTSRCSPGIYKGGAIVGLSGTGGTGPHMHIQIRDEAKYQAGGDGRFDPPKSVLLEISR